MGQRAHQGPPRGCVGARGDPQTANRMEHRLMEITIITTTPEHRHIAQTLEFVEPFSQHINWESVAARALELGAHFEARYNGLECTITFFWVVTEAEAIQHARDAFDNAITAVTEPHPGEINGARGL